ncbi:MAG TPA: substrate-binding domain-containing protein [Candidatus Acidoferrum sp.]|jgi:phosphate transport system substrate-binding protein
MRRRIAPLLLICFVSLASWSARGEVVLRVTGADTMKNFGQRLSDWYARKNSTVHFTIQAAPQSSSFAEMAGGKADIVQSSRRASHSEQEMLRSAQGKNFVELQVATEIATISLNTGNPIKELSLYELRQVLSGEIKNWKQVGGHEAPINIYGLNSSYGVASFLEEEFMGDLGISSAAKTFATNAAVFAAVSHDPNGIGFGTFDPRVDAKVRFLAIKASSSADAVLPSADTIRGNRYKLVRPLYFYLSGPPSGDLLRFAQWVLSAEGQLVVEAVGYYPLGSAEREEGNEILSGHKTKK